MLHDISLAFHLLACVVWVGGMFLIFFAIRPALPSLDEAQRFHFITAVLGRFFPWVWASIITLISSGLLMIYAAGGFDSITNSTYLMAGLAIVMLAIFKFIVLAPYRHLTQATQEENWPVATFTLDTIRSLVAINLTLGILIIFIATVFRGW